MKMTRLEKFFVNRRTKGRYNSELLRERLDQIDRGPVHDVLELGCGLGYVSAFLAKEYKLSVVGTDVDPEQIDKARNLHLNGELLQFHTRDAADLGFAAGSFDLVVSQNVFHHLPEWRRAAREVARVLRVGGYLIWLDLALPAFARNALQPLVKTAGVYTLAEVREAFQKNGLSQVFYERLSRWPLRHHHLVMQKA